MFSLSLLINGTGRQSLSSDFQPAVHEQTTDGQTDEQIDIAQSLYEGKAT